MAQKRHLGLDAPRRGKAAQRPGAQHPVAGDQDRDRVRPAGLTHRLRRRTDRPGDVAIGPRLAERNAGHGAAHPFVQALAPIQRQIEDLPFPRKVLRQLAEYFAGERQVFDLPLDWGQGLHERVRRAMAGIPFGETRTYGDIARAVGAPAQAVGQACGANPIPILIPCHRVLGARTLGGFSAPGGVETKVALLRHEGAAGLLI